ncbi:molybdopterin-binding/glycosyltransferase family 2 protein [Kaistia terrae]|uniref:Molybdopterin-binding/glycosyltransferase family 2 protein n=1 Tax=Kaistia terrae TaxID=537017 RepID=A0ABW0PRA2_9HYPH|nr:molybdopterin-binding/glycosyltransferase family 2 protein [Kaistia terrae]MCX5578388.1 molybdopterin-binding/glycosyltransferase family 2 protein [Kaistia terrae]
MKFGPHPVSEAEGAILAHSLHVEGRTLKKGLRLTRDHLAILAAAGIETVLVARLEAGDIHEDAAAVELAGAVSGSGISADAPFTGRANLHASDSGLLVVDRDAIDRFNRVDPAITLATLPEHAPVIAGQMVATVKIIPFGVGAASIGQALAIAGATALVRVAPYRPMRVGLVSTRLPSLKVSTMDKTRRMTEARLKPSGSTLLPERRVAHDSGAIAKALAELSDEGAKLLIVFGASAMVDAGDVVPAGIREAGGNVIHLGMPVDPGNLLVLGELDGKPVIGAPGCARSPRENGFDWILGRILAGLPVGPCEITGLGVGGLLMEIASRPQPREAVVAHAPKIAALVLAAGQGRRMGGPNKLLAEIDGRSLVRTVVDAAGASRAASVTVVTGHRRQEVEQALVGTGVRTVHNPDYAEGLSTSLRQGVARLGDDIDGVVVMLADMPMVTSAILDRLIEAFDPSADRLVVVPTHLGKRGNPVLWSRAFFAELCAIEGDTGARHLIGAHADAVVEVEIGPEVALDLDTPEALRAMGGTLPA